MPESRPVVAIAAALVLSIAAPVNAQEDPYSPHPHHGPRPTAAGAATLPGPAVHADRIEQVVAPPAPIAASRDVAVLQAFYVDQQQHLAALEAPLASARAAGDLDTTESLGRLWADHAILASRARQLLRAYHAPFPRAVAATPSGFVPIAEGRADPGGLYATWRQQVTDPRLIALLDEAAAVEARHATVAAGPMAAMLGAPSSAITTVVVIQPLPAEAVAGAREVREAIPASDLALLRDFYRAQWAAASALLAEADQLEGAGDLEGAAMWRMMAQQHQRIAQRAASLLQAAGQPLPTVMPHEPFRGTPQQIRAHQLQHHQEELAQLPEMRNRARHPEVRRLFADALAGTQQHVDQLAREAVAGIREERLSETDLTLLRQFYRARALEARLLTAQAMALRQAGMPMEAERWERMADEHQEFALRPLALLRKQGVTPAPPPAVAFVGTCPQMRSHQIQAHQVALARLDRMIARAEHPDIRTLFQEARRGRTSPTTSRRFARDSAHDGSASPGSPGPGRSPHPRPTCASSRAAR